MGTGSAGAGSAGAGSAGAGSAGDGSTGSAGAGSAGTGPAGGRSAGSGPAGVGPLAVRPGGPASAGGLGRLWRDPGFAGGAVLAGIIADVIDPPAAIWTVAFLTAAAGTLVAVRMRETHPQALARSQ